LKDFGKGLTKKLGKALCFIVGQFGFSWGIRRFNGGFGGSMVDLVGLGRGG
jgi:hypothetical protein